MPLREERYMAVIAMLAIVLLASHGHLFAGGRGILADYLY